MTETGTNGDSCETQLAGLEAVLFDLDGTLIDTLDMIRASMRYATEHVLGEPLPDQVLMHNVGVPLITQMREFDEVRAEELVRVYREHNARVHDAMVREYPGVNEGLDRLGQLGFRLGIVTSKSAAVAQRGLERFSLERFFEVIVTYDDVPVHKPDPHPLCFAAERLGVPADKCAYVGDSPHDMTAAIRAGCLAIAALWGVSSPERVLEPGPAYAVNSMADVSALFDGEAERYRVS
ncbi:MAG TPA: HAD-IA family hydrolase [Coriobacteriia bacterium]|nr:HAD-IA family hydrolase [Coriobacteriia bacterium]